MHCTLPIGGDHLGDDNFGHNNIDDTGDDDDDNIDDGGSQMIGLMMIVIMMTTKMMMEKGQGWLHCTALAEHDLLLAMLLLDCTSFLV